MPVHDKEVDIARNFRLLEWLKAELVGGVAALLRAAVKGSQEAILDALAGIVVTAYLLGKRLGVSFARLDAKMRDKLESSISEDHEIECWYGDLSALLYHLKSKR
ncbi:MAG: MazG-like family protein [Bacillota bacterium]